ncbi:MAG: hypothetical protein IJD06_05030 [Clostridia bacterium]|nr:hypothetical protein [Clostridia bacterium]
MESSNTTPQLSCEQVRQLLDEKSAGASPEALHQHLKTCADCRAELRLRAVMSQMLAEPPADLTDSVMNRIRAEQKKTAGRLRFIRRAGAVAAAVVLIPAVVILAPILLRTGNSVTSDDAARDEETRAQIVDTTLPETTAAALFGTFSGAYSAPIAPDADAPEAEKSPAKPASTNEASKILFSTASASDTGTPQPSPETVPETAPVSAAPSYVRPKEQSATERQTSPSTMASDTAAAAPQSELPVYAVLRALVGERVLSAHIAAFSGSDVDLPAYLCGMFSVTREEFVEQAQNMSLTFTDEELDLLFPAENQ